MIIDEIDRLNERVNNVNANIVKICQAMEHLSEAINSLVKQLNEQGLTIK
jgi:hypothetical protein